jgi:signal transduction histidine kinase
MSDDLLDALPDGVVVAGPDGIVEAINRAAARMLGVDADAAAGSRLADVLTLRDNDGQSWVDQNCPYDTRLRTRSGVPEQAWLVADGSEVLVVARLHRPSLDHPVDRVAITLRDGRGRARLDRDRSDLVATVAHELRSPLTGVKGFVQALLNRWDKLNDEQKRLMLRTVHSDSERLSRLIAELLDVARIDTGRLALHPRPCDASALAQRVVASVRAGTARAIELTGADDLPQIHADPDKFVQVLTNLVENAVRHGDGAVRVALSPLRQGEYDGVRIVVEDEGEGIAPEMRRRVFTKFWTGGARGGSGLGLYLVRGLVTAHGGQITLGDAEGGGARIVVDWPAPTEPAY